MPSSARLARRSPPRLGEDRGPRFAAGPQARFAQGLVDELAEAAAFVRVAGEGEGAGRFFAERAQGRRAGKVPRLDDDDRVLKRRRQKRFDGRREVAPGRPHPDGAPAAEEADRQSLVGEPRRVGGDRVAVEADELEGVGGIVDRALGEGAGALGDEARIGSKDEKNADRRVGPALEKRGDVARLDRDHRLRIWRRAPPRGASGSARRGASQAGSRRRARRGSRRSAGCCGRSWRCWSRGRRGSSFRRRGSSACR